MGVRTYMAFGVHYRGVHKTEAVECKKLFLEVRYIYLQRNEKT